MTRGDDACNNPGKTKPDAKGFFQGPLRKKNAHLRQRQTVLKQDVLELSEDTDDEWILPITEKHFPFLSCITK